MTAATASAGTARLCLALVAVAWLGNACYAVGLPGGTLATVSAVVIALAMLAFTGLHGLRALGARSFAIFVLTVIAVAWAAETVGQLTGLPYGQYRYAETMRPFLGEVPVVVLLTYAVMTYVCWSMAAVILGRAGRALDRTGRIAVPLLAAALMVVWDVSMDPLRSSLEGRWVWQDTGTHYGVPSVNFLGWFAVSWLMFQLYAVLARDHRGAGARDGRLFWLSVPLMYLAFPVEYVLNPFVADPALVAGAVGLPSATVAEIHREIALLTGMTIVPLALVAMGRARRA